MPRQTSTLNSCWFSAIAGEPRKTFSFKIGAVCGVCYIPIRRIKFTQVVKSVRFQLLKE